MGTLWAQPFDPESAQLNGAPVAIARDVLEDPTIWCAVFSVNDSGTLVYQTGQAGTALTLYDRDGHELGPVGEHGIIFDVNISPDGKRVAVNRGEPADIWVYELGRGTSLRLTFDPRNETLPVWSPDGHTLAYARIEPDGRAAVDGGAIDRRRAHGDDSAGRCHRHGLVARRQVPAPAPGLARHGPVDMYAAPANQASRARPLLETSFVEYHARFSPDGRWVSYVSNESGRDEVYVMRFRPPMPGMPAPTIAGGRVRISTAGGTLPRWRADQTELYYLAADLQVMAALVDGKGETFTVHSVAPLFSVNPKPVGWAYDVTPDGQRFIVNSLGDEGRRPLVLVTDWASGLTSPPR